MYAIQNLKATLNSSPYLANVVSSVLVNNQYNNKFLNIKKNRHENAISVKQI
jgi:hypothetical protein